MSDPKTASADIMLQASRVMKALGHPTRLEIGKYLRQGEHSVADIQRHLGLIQPLTSQHLRLMHRRGIVKFRREGTTCYYSIAGTFIHKVLACLDEFEPGILSAKEGAAALSKPDGAQRRGSRLPRNGKEANRNNRQQRALV